jgi:uncharacterized membrane protein YccF (DUF307 family)
MDAIRLVGNILWFVLGGAIIALIWLLGAVVFAISIVGLPLTRAAFEMAKLSAFPFGKEVIYVRDLDARGPDLVTVTTGTIGVIVNILWALTFGWVLFLSYVIAGVLNCVTIIGIPFGIQSFKLAAISFWPVGRRVVRIEVAEAARQRNAKEALERYR